MDQENTNKKKPTRPIFILPVICILLWIGFCIKPIKLLFTWEKITWTVVDVRSKESKDDEWNLQTLYSPVIRYTCGWKEVTESPGYFSSQRYTKNESITLLCNESKPTEFVTYWSFVPLIFTLYGLMFLFIQIFNIKNAKKVKKTDNSEEWDDIEELNIIEEPENTQSLESKPKKNLLQKNLSDIEFFKKFPSVKIDNALWTAIIALFASVGIWYIIYNFLFGDGEKEISWAIFLWIFELVFTYLFIIKTADYIRAITAKFKIRRWDLIIIQATVIWFQHTADALDSTYYKIICTNGLSEFYSAETEWKIYWFDDIPLNYLEALKIMYNPKNPQKTLYELDNHPQKMRIKSSYKETVSRLIKQISEWENYKKPYWIFNEKMVYIWDTINVYVDPQNSKSYLVDLSFLE